MKDHLKRLRAARLPRVVVRFEGAAGEDAQVDFGVFPYLDAEGRSRSWPAFVSVLSFARATCVEFVKRQDVGTLLRCL